MVLKSREGGAQMTYHLFSSVGNRLVGQIKLWIRSSRI